MLRHRRGTGVLEPLLGGDVGGASGTPEDAVESVSRLWSVVAPWCTLVGAAQRAV